MPPPNGVNAWSVAFTPLWAIVLRSIVRVPSDRQTPATCDAIAKARR